MDPTTDGSAVPVPPPESADPIVFPTGDEIYDALMKNIEPELMSANIPNLDDAYTNESDEDRTKRYERYSEAFAKYDEAYAMWEDELNEAVTNYRRTALQSAEAVSRNEDTDALALLEQDILSGPAAGVSLAA